MQFAWPCWDENVPGWHCCWESDPSEGTWNPGPAWKHEVAPDMIWYVPAAQGVCSSDAKSVT